jgi:hypothetical protein
MGLPFIRTDIERRIARGANSPPLRRIKACAQLARLISKLAVRIRFGFPASPVWRPDHDLAATSSHVLAASASRKLGTLGESLHGGGAEAGAVRLSVCRPGARCADFPQGVFRMPRAPGCRLWASPARARGLSVEMVHPCDMKIRRGDGLRQAVDPDDWASGPTHLVRHGAHPPRDRVRLGPPGRHPRRPASRWAGSAHPRTSPGARSIWPATRRPG